MSRWLPYADAGYVETLQSFVREHVTPQGDAIDRDDIYPVEIIKRLARDGLSTITLPEEFGGGGKDFSHAVALFEEVGYGSASTAICLITIFQASTIIRLFGEQSLKERYLPRFREGLLSSYALTEANHGSDIRSDR